VPPDYHELLVRRARREYRVPIRSSGLDRRNGFEETVLGYTAEEAIREASRCLDCDRICSLCVGVCPNMALLTYEVAPRRVDLPELAVADGAVVATGSRPFVVDQALQIAVLTDFCNECGNCVTACPTSGRPYLDKPRLYLDRADFEAQASNAFMLLGDGVVEARVDGTTHRLALNGRLEYAAPGFRAVLDPETFALLEATATAGADGEALSLEPAAVMATLLAGVTGSLPHLPTASSLGGGTRVMHPGYGD
jgi:putative selenate reductase